VERKNKNDYELSNPFEGSKTFVVRDEKVRGAPMETISQERSKPY